MKKIISLPVVVLLALIAGSAQAYHTDGGCELPFMSKNWYITPKVGAAPAIFASHRAHQLFVVPLAGLDSAACNAQLPECSIANFANVLQEGRCLPKFSDIFHQGVLHIGFELGYSPCDSSAVFIEFVYNRAKGKTFCPASYITNKANEGCTQNCETTCASSCRKDSCCPTGTNLSGISSLNDAYETYQAYGAYIGGRHFTNRFWCDSTAFWAGFKVGILHRKQVNATTNITYDVSGCEDCTEEDEVSQCFNRAIFCKSNSVSGGIQFGFDYCFNDCINLQLGFEVVASCGLRGNKNYPIDISAITCGDDVSLTNCVAIPSNIIVSNTGTLLNFPIWLGLKWEFGCCETRCN